MLRAQLTVLAIVATLLVNFSTVVRAEETTPTAAQVEQLQAQLADMQKEMAAMRKTIEGLTEIPAEQRQTMEQQLGRMQGHWQGMHQQCCMMNPTGCPHMQH